jgi:hypothetical protein
MIAILKAEQAPAIVFEQAQLPVQGRQFVQLQQHGEDAIFEAVMPGAQPAMHDPALIN